MLYCVFELSGRYVIANARGLARGNLDGSPLRGPVTLRAGTYRFARAVADERIVCFWANAYERGYSPFRRGRASP
jgi:hypothetical protein